MEKLIGGKIMVSISGLRSVAELAGMGFKRMGRLTREGNAVYKLVEGNTTQYAVVRNGNVLREIDRVVGSEGVGINKYFGNGNSKGIGITYGKNGAFSSTIETQFNMHELPFVKKQTIFVTPERKVSIAHTAQQEGTPIPDTIVNNFAKGEGRVYYMANGTQKSLNYSLPKDELPNFTSMTEARRPGGVFDCKA